MDTKIYITGMGICREAPSHIETPKTVKTVIRPEELALSASAAALKQAGYLGANMKSVPGDMERLGIIFGIDNAIDSCKAQFFKGLLQDGPLGASPLLFPYTSPNALTAQVTIAFGIKGEDITITDGALSFLKAICYGLELLTKRVIQSAIIGGVSENEAMALTVESFHLYNKKNRKILGKIISYEDPLKSSQQEEGAIIDTIEDSFRLFVDAIKDKKPINVFEKQGRGVGLIVDI